MTENVLAELICSPVDLLEEIILNENASIEDLEQILPVLDDIINHSKSLYSTVVDRIKFLQLDKEGLYITKYRPIFYPKGEKIIENKYMMSKFYGLPFMCKREPWPKNEKGVPLKFLCQIIHPDEIGILYRIFINADENENANALYTILPIEFATSKWLKGTAMSFKDIPYNPNEYVIKEWVPYKEYNYLQMPLIDPILLIEEMHIYFGKKYLLQLEENNILLI